MPLLNVPPEVDAMVTAGRYELQSTLDIVLSNGEELHVSTTVLTGIETIDFGVIDYTDQLREMGTMEESLTLSANRVEIAVENVTGELRELLFDDPDVLIGANGIYSYVFINEDDEKFQVEILHGRIVAPVDQDPNGSLQIVSHLSSDGAIGGYRNPQDHCFNRYKIDPRCGSQSDLAQGCDKTEDGPNGCDKHLPAEEVTMPVEADNRSRHTGFLYHIEPLPGAQPAGETGVVDGGGDFNTHWRNREETGGYTGRYEIPRYLI